MKQTLFSLLMLFAFSLTAFAQEEVDLRIDGIGFGSTHTQVIRKFGKPNRIKNEGINECANGEELTYSYPGLKIGLLSEGEGKNKIYKVYSVEVTSSNRAINSDIKIGTIYEEVLTKFGKPSETAADKSSLVYVNKDNNGFAGFTFKDNKLVKIVWEETIC